MRAANLFIKALTAGGGVVRVGCVILAAQVNSPLIKLDMRLGFSRRAGDPHSSIDDDLMKFPRRWNLCVLRCECQVRLIKEG